MTKICLNFAREGDPFGTQLPDTFVLKKTHIGVTVYLLDSLSLKISSHRYVKDIL